MDDKKIRIKAFCCKQSAIEAYRMAETLKLEIPEELEIEEVRCSGNIDIEDILLEFENGIDSVMVIACHEGNCLFISGNIRAKKRVENTKRFLDDVGLSKERLEIFTLASNMGHGFSRIAKDMRERVIKIGKSPLIEK